MKINISFAGLLGIVYIVLKLCGVISWPWAVVTLPLWGGFVLAVIVAFVGIVVDVVKRIINGHSKSIFLQR